MVGSTGWVSGAADFNAMKLDEVVALTAATNIPSQRVMQRLGTTHDPQR